jgi:hypothetical protein
MKHVLAVAPIASASAEATTLRPQYDALSLPRADCAETELGRIRQYGLEPARRESLSDTELYEFRRFLDLTAFVQVDTRHHDATEVSGRTCVLKTTFKASSDRKYPN